MTREQVFWARAEQVQNGIWAMTKSFVISLPISIFIGFISWLILSKLEKKNEVIRERKWAAVGLITYFMILIQMGLLSRPFGSTREIKWIPFNTPGGDYLIVLYSLANLVYFIPLGLLLASVFKKTINNVFKAGLAALIVSLFIEIMQFLLACGTSEVEDLIMNVAGGIVGYLIYKGTIKIINKRRV